MVNFVNNASDVMALFPTSVDDINQRVDYIKQRVQKDMDKLLSYALEERTFENTAFALDRLSYWFKTDEVIIGMLKYVSPDKDLRDASQNATQKLVEFAIDILDNNKALYEAFKTYVENNAPTESLDETQRYFLQETMKEFKRSGLHLPDQERAELSKLKKELADLSLQFSRNIAEGQRFIPVVKEELVGVDDDFIASLQKDEHGRYILNTDYPTVSMVMDHCSVEETRRAMYFTFHQRAYPENMPVLDDIIAKRDAKAAMLGFASYADYDLDNQMVKTVERAEQFINELVSKTRAKEEQEYALFTKDLPEGVMLTEDGKIKPWDISYILEQHKNKNYKLDSRIVAEYFPTEKTISGLLGIYEEFFGLTFKNVSVSNAWHEDVKLIEVYDQDESRLRGYLILDLYPREGKYSHAAQFDLIDTILDDQGNIKPAVGCVVANFPKSTATKPSLLTHKDVITFFHEFGHALHYVNGSTRLASFSGTAVKRDFVELPSQLLEEWMWDKEMLQRISCHYVTGESIPNELVETMINLKNLSRGYAILRQMFYASLSLEYFKSGDQKDTNALREQLHKKILSHNSYESEAYTQAAFGHLTGYGAKYYGYMWSKVFALDIFAAIKKEGLLNTTMGQRLIDTILGKGGSKDPNELLFDFLGREPNQEAFLEDLGL